MSRTAGWVTVADRQIRTHGPNISVFSRAAVRRRTSVTVAHVGGLFRHLVSPTGHNYSLRTVDRMEQQFRNFVWHCDHRVVPGRELMIVVNASRLCGSRATSWLVTDAIDIGPRDDRS